MISREPVRSAAAKCSKESGFRNASAETMLLHALRSSLTARWKMLILRLAITNQLAGEEEAVIDILWLGVTAGLMLGIPIGFSIGRGWKKLGEVVEVPITNSSAEPQTPAPKRKLRELKQQ